MERSELGCKIAIRLGHMLTQPDSFFVDSAWMIIDEELRMSANERMHPVRRCDQVIQQYESLVSDIEWWNQNRIDALPFDVGGAKVCLDLTRKVKQALLRNDADAFRKLYPRLIEAASRDIEAGTS
jgi:hypothetical protein